MELFIILICMLCVYLYFQLIKYLFTILRQFRYNPSYETYLIARTLAIGYDEVEFWLSGCAYSQPHFFESQQKIDYYQNLIIWIMDLPISPEIINYLSMFWYASGDNKIYHYIEELTQNDKEHIAKCAERTLLEMTLIGN